MDIVATSSSPGFFSRMHAFMAVIFEPKLHFGFAALWFLSLQGTMVALTDTGPFVLGLHTLAGIATLFFVLFYLRAIDEVKDFEYDRVNNPDRPLVTGLVTRSDIRAYAIVSAVIVGVINLPLGAGLVAFVAADMAYGLLLMWIQANVSWMKRSMFFNLAVTYPVSIALSVYTMLQTMWLLDAPWGAALIAPIGAYILAFLHFELVRKTEWPDLAEPGEQFYSHDIGGAAAVALGFAVGVAAVAAMLWLTKPWDLSGAAAVTGWLPCLALVWAVKSLVRALRNRHRRSNPRPFAVAFIATFYAANLAHAIAATRWTLG